MASSAASQVADPGTPDSPGILLICFLRIALFIMLGLFASRANHPKETCSPSMSTPNSQQEEDGPAVIRLALGSSQTALPGSPSLGSPSLRAPRR